MKPYLLHHVIFQKLLSHQAERYATQLQNCKLADHIRCLHPLQAGNSKNILKKEIQKKPFKIRPKTMVASLDLTLLSARVNNSLKHNKAAHLARTFYHKGWIDRLCPTSVISLHPLHFHHAPNVLRAPFPTSQKWWILSPSPSHPSLLDNLPFKIFGHCPLPIYKNTVYYIFDSSSGRKYAAFYNLDSSSEAKFAEWLNGFSNVFL